MAMQPISRDEVLRVVRTRGPIIPNELKKALSQGDTILLGAILSELASKGLVKISKTKLGGSPFYYDPAQPGALEKIGQHLNEKDRRTLALLKERKVLKDTAHEALIRVSLRAIKDFAVPLRVNAPDGEQLWWKYYLVSDAEAEQLIKRALGMADEPTVEPATPEAPQQPARWGIEPHTEGGKALTPTPRPTETSSVPEQKKETRKEAKQIKVEEEQAPLQPGEIDDPFYKKVRSYFDRQSITVKEQKLIRKKSELEFIILLPTPVGNVEYFCKAKAKKKSNGGDLAAAKLQGNAKNLPVLYLTTGEVTKKAKEKLASEFKGLVVKEL